MTNRTNSTAKAIAAAAICLLCTISFNVGGRAFSASRVATRTAISQSF